MVCLAVPTYKGSLITPAVPTCSHLSCVPTHTVPTHAVPAHAFTYPRYAYTYGLLTHAVPSHAFFYPRCAYPQGQLHYLYARDARLCPPTREALLRQKADQNLPIEIGKPTPQDHGRQSGSAVVVDSGAGGGRHLMQTVGVYCFLCIGRSCWQLCGHLALHPMQQNVFAVKLTPLCVLWMARTCGSGVKPLTSQSREYLCSVAWMATM
eukprot:1160899-Pelagomonas_calceolata.AAC.4